METQVSKCLLLWQREVLSRMSVGDLAWLWDINIIFNAVTIARFKLSVITYLGGTAVLRKGALCFVDQKEIIYFHMLRWTWITKQQRKQCETNLVLHGLLDMMRTIMCYIYKQYSLISEWWLQLKSTFTSSSFLFSFLYCAVKLSMDMANNPAK